ncbi:hypothetical protein [Microbacterium sp. OVT16B]|nr:hypothetical protein [Microbacterium sp. OVT16B]
MLAAVAASALPSAALADTTAADEDAYGTSEAAMVAVWTEYDVPAATQDQLLAKLDQGTPLDSMLGLAPVSQEEHSEGAKQVTVSRFSDGSVAVSSIAPDSSSLARSVDGCTTVATTYATNCKVYGWLGPVEMSFRSSYTKNDRHASVYNWGQTTWGCGPGTCSEPVFELVRQYQSGESAAQINLKTNYNFATGNTSVTLSLFVKDRTAWSN